MQRWFPHSNWVAEQNLSKGEVRTRKVQGKDIETKQQSVVLYSVYELTTMSLVRTVLTVVLLITGPAHRDATSAGAGEEGRWTLCFPAPWQSSRKEVSLKRKHQRVNPA